MEKIATGGGNLLRPLYKEGYMKEILQQAEELQRACREAREAAERALAILRGEK